MNFEIKDSESVLILKTKDKFLDASNSLSYKSQIINYIRSRKSLILLDLSSIEFIDSSGLGAFIAIYKVLDQKDRVRIIGLKKEMKKIFELTKTDCLFAFFPSEKEALNSGY